MGLSSRFEMRSKLPRVVAEAQKKFIEASEVLKNLDDLQSTD